MNPYVFFVGCPRSGTTLLRRIGDAHPDLAIVDQTRWIARTFEERRGVTGDGFVTPKLLERMRDPHRLGRLELTEADLARLSTEAGRLHFSSFVTALFDFYGERTGKPLVGDKSPGYVRYLPTLNELWPEAKFVHIVRDGRDVCLSVLDWGKGARAFPTYRDDPVTTTAVWWEWYVRLGREDGRRLPAGLYHELRYEALVAQPEEECRRLCDFLGLEFDAAMLRFHEGRERHEPGLGAKRAWKPVTKGLRSWREQMPHADVARFEAAVGDLLDELGYDRGVPDLPAGELERAAQLRERFVDALRRRRLPVPRAWPSERVPA